VLGNAGLALSELPPESPARYSVEQIQLSAQQAAELCRQMLAYSGRGQFVIQSLDLSRLVRGISHLIDRALSSKALVEFHLADGLPAVEGDATQLRQVVLNLLTNAAEAIGDRSGLVIVRTGVMHVGHAYLAEAVLGEDLAEGEYVFLEVTDTGQGMDEQILARAFEPFFTTKYSGRGLGLAAVMGIVRGHGGAIRVESGPGQGTTFEVILPPAGSSVAIPQTGVPDAEGSWRGSGTVLVVDDEEVVRVVSRRTLESRGFEVLTAADGQEGLDLFEEHAEDICLVLVDLTMPRMNGDDAFRRMREMRPDVRGILLSGYTREDAAGQFAQDGLAGFIQKPYDQATLVAAVRGALES
jgi:CheY-like chemotaxis protein